ncbi:hypothetical protein niasHT_015994 [Heterodera trifolii]|uniref:Uncharacterized protein n=1 Tax=Heterodera trifolii TaxID=157864 RepID=A0ABD2L175_9BILA
MPDIVAVLVSKMKEMIENLDWKHANFLYTNALEWHLLKYYIGKIGAMTNWEEIEQLHNEWAHLYDEHFKGNEINSHKIDQVIKKLINTLNEIR